MYIYSGKGDLCDTNMEKHKHTFIFDFGKGEKEALCDSKKNILVEMNGNDVFYEGDNYFLVVNGYFSENFATFYTLEGKYIGKASISVKEFRKNTPIIRYVEFENILALGRVTKSDSDNYEWTFYNSQGEQILDKECLPNIPTDSDTLLQLSYDQMFPDLILKAIEEKDYRGWEIYNSRDKKSHYFNGDRIELISSNALAQTYKLTLKNGNVQILKYTVETGLVLED